MQPVCGALVPLGALADHALADGAVGVDALVVRLVASVGNRGAFGALVALVALADSAVGVHGVHGVHGALVVGLVDNRGALDALGILARFKSCFGLLHGLSQASRSVCILASWSSSGFERFERFEPDDLPDGFERFERFELDDFAL